jgi:hypothetical protein
MKSKNQRGAGQWDQDDQEDDHRRDRDDRRGRGDRDEKGRRDDRRSRGDQDDRGAGRGGGGTLPEITVTDQSAPIFELDWLNACADKVAFDKRTETFIKEVSCTVKKDYQFSHPRSLTKLSRLAGNN